MLLARSRRLGITLLGCCSIAPCLAATVVFDSFTEGPFAIEMYIPPTLANTNSFSGPIGTSRRVTMPSPSRALLFMNSTLATDHGGSLSLDFAMRSGYPVSPYILPLSYRNGGPYSILGQTAFEFDFAEFTGLGNLIIQIGSESLVDASTTRVSLSGPGTVVVPFDRINFSAGGSLGNFNEVHFLFETASEAVSFSLGEIRIVPEPSTMGLLILGLGLLVRRNR